MRQLKITVNGKVYDVMVEEVGGSPAVVSYQEVAVTAPVPEAPKAKTLPSSPPPSVPTAAGKEIKAPIPGVVQRILVSPGQKVKRGDVVLILEAMKMENEIMASVEGVIKEILVTSGQSVAAGEILVILE